LINGPYPDYALVIPCGEPQHGTATIDRKSLLRGVTAVTKFVGESGEHFPKLRFGFHRNRLAVETAFFNDNISASAAASIDVTTIKFVEPQDVGFNGYYVIDILKTLRGRTVQFGFFAADKPNTFVGDEADKGALHVIMPMNLHSAEGDPPNE
jgi:DNA polymerase III sliding clamp (beta) subunit (PCNA family)